MHTTEEAVPDEIAPDRNTHSSKGPALADALIKPTPETYEQLQHAYDHMNEGLFGGSLPNTLITLQRRNNRTYGYFSGDRFAREDGQQADEIALNPAHFRERQEREILSTLAHEMAHLWQHHFGKPGRGRYHNKQWAAKMKEIGLQPTDTGEEGGKETGDRMTHIIMQDGACDSLIQKMLASGYVITWMEQPLPADRFEPGGDDGGQERKAREIRLPARASGGARPRFQGVGAARRSPALRRAPRTDGTRCLGGIPGGIRRPVLPLDFFLYLILQL